MLFEIFLFFSMPACTLELPKMILLGAPTIMVVAPIWVQKQSSTVLEVRQIVIRGAEKQKPVPELELVLAINRANTAVRADALFKNRGFQRVND